jgi:hypothetical protein
MKSNNPEYREACRNATGSYRKLILSLCVDVRGVFYPSELSIAGIRRSPGWEKTLRMDCMHTCVCAPCHSGDFLCIGEELLGIQAGIFDCAV